MFNLESYINLPAAWGFLLAVAVLLYVVLDGFDLGIGILFPFAPSDNCRDKMMSSIAPFWDGNETWLVLGGGGLFAAFPTAYSILMPALYIPILFMLMALIFRGIAFEFRFKASEKNKRIWDASFHFGSLFAAFMQGIILGSIIQGIEVENMAFAGSSFDWLTGFSIMTGIAVVSGYALLGATWIIMKTTQQTKSWANKCAKYSFIHMMFFMLIVSVWTPFLDKEIFRIWFSIPNLFYLSIIPFVSIIVSFNLIKSLIDNNCDYKPFICTILLFILSFVGLFISMWPYVIPRSLTWVQTAAAPESQSLMLVAALIVLPIILFYVGYTYYIFRGKIKSEDATY